MFAQPKKPTCIGFIMDGNRRWAKAAQKDTLEGHKKGAEVFSSTIQWAQDNNIQHVVFYAFSSENWNRSKQEVEYLTHLFAELVQDLKKKLLETAHNEQKVRFRFIGDIDRFGKTVKGLVRDVEEESRKYTDTTVWVALSYGGRGEIVDAVNAAVVNGDPVNEMSFRTLLASAEMPDPDIIVRSGGERRLSNFLTWQSVYSELLFLDILWPDMTVDDLNQVLATYNERKRNFGK